MSEIANRPTGIQPGYACNCVGPQFGQPLCPCRMLNVVQRNGRWIETERDLGPVKPEPVVPMGQRGCVCPPGAEATCQGSMCPRKPSSLTCFSFAAKALTQPEGE